MSKLDVKVDYVCKNLIRVEQEVAANLVRELYLQRAELLEALKGVQKSLGHMMHPNQRAAVVTAIAKADASE